MHIFPPALRHHSEEEALKFPKWGGGGVVVVERDKKWIWPTALGGPRTALFFKDTTTKNSPPQNQKGVVSFSKSAMKDVWWRCTREVDGHARHLFYTTTTTRPVGDVGNWRVGNSRAALLSNFSSSLLSPGYLLRKWMHRVPDRTFFVLLSSPWCWDKELMRKN